MNFPIMVLLDNTCDHVDGSPVNAASIGIAERHPLPDGWGLTAWGPNGPRSGHSVHVGLRFRTSFAPEVTHETLSRLTIADTAKAALGSCVVCGRSEADPPGVRDQ